MTSQILLVGAGQLGSRYLQGLTLLKEPSAIYIVDPSEEALGTSKSRFEEIDCRTEHKVHFYGSIEKIPSRIDLALVATPAHCRADVIKEISGCAYVSSWILEKLLAQSCAQLDKIANALINCKQVWVNTPRRLMEWHQQIRAELTSRCHETFSVEIHGGRWGMACNAVHFIDLVSWWSQSSVNSVTCSSLNTWAQSKRVGFQEIFGTMTVNYDDGSQLDLYCSIEDEPVQITVTSNQGRWLIDEVAGQATEPDGKKLLGKLTFQSELTAPLVEKVLQEGRCDLPNLEESTTQHRPLLSALLDHWNQSTGCQSSVVPVT